MLVQRAWSCYTYMIYSKSMRAAALLVVQPWEKKKKKVQNPVAAWRTETDGQPLRSYVLRDNHRAHHVWLSSAGSTVIAFRFQPSAVSNRSRVSYKASNAHTKMVTFSRPVSSTKLRPSWATDHESCRGFHPGH